MGSQHRKSWSYGARDLFLLEEVVCTIVLGHGACQLFCWSWLKGLGDTALATFEGLIVHDNKHHHEISGSKCHQH